jgi:hypothetical protein
MSAQARKLLDEVRKAATNPRQAYLIRTRLRRSILACTRYVMHQEGRKLPSIPQEVDIAILSPRHQEIGEVCNRLLAASSSLMPTQ